MIRETAFIINTHPDSFRPGIPATIIGVDLVTPKDLGTTRLAYHIRYLDGTEDWIAIHDNANYKIVSFNELPKLIV